MIMLHFRGKFTAYLSFITHLRGIKHATVEKDIYIYQPFLNFFYYISQKVNVRNSTLPYHLPTAEVLQSKSKCVALASFQV